MTQIDQVYQLAAMGVDYAGFNFYHRSPRYIIGKVEPGELKSLGQIINKVGVFVNEDYDVIMKTVEDYGLNVVQLHGDETPDFCSRISSSVKTIKAFRIAGDEDMATLLRGYFDTPDYFLFDTKAKEYGGTGKKFNWDILQQTSLNKQYFLSGGIALGDETAIKKFIDDSIFDDLYALDLNSKFESRPGVKEMGLIEQFINKLK